MKITVSWLREQFDSQLNYKEIVYNLNKLGFELKKEYSNPLLWKQIEIIKIIEKKQHPNADKLNIYSIEKKDGLIINIVCGDTSLKVGNFAPYAHPGIMMPSGEMLRTANIRGIESPGMLCNASEIDLPIQINGVLKCFEEDWGKSIAEAYESEGIFEIELTPNRGDALSIFGIARILRNADLGTLKPLEYNEFLLPKQKFFEVKSSGCQGLACTLFHHDLKPTNPKIIKKLQLTEHSTFNIDVVDLTNYISHYIGLPMHVFDYDKIKNNRCCITNLEKDQEFETLAKQKIQLKSGTLVFKSGEDIISWPSVIGGNNSKVDENTKNILLETGVFTTDPIQRRKHGVLTSAAKKAEYGINPFILKQATNIFFTILEEKPISQQYIPFKKNKKILFNFDKVKEILGSNISFEKFKKSMSKKGFVFNKDSTVTPPNHKFFDINTENCIIEEFVTDKYDLIESINLSPKYIKTKQSRDNLSLISLICGFNECKNISLGKLEHENFEIPLVNRKILNYSNQNYSVLRGSLIPDLLKNMSWHIKNQQKIYNFFEYGIIYGEYPNKQYKIFTAISNKITDLQNLFSKFLADKNLNNNILSRIEDIPYSDNSHVFYVNDKKTAILSKIKQNILKNFNIQECYALEVFPSILNIKHNVKTTKPSNLIPIYQDITFKINAKKSVSEIVNLLHQKKLNYKILSVYPSNNLNIHRNITIQFMIEQQTTFSKEQINKKIQSITNEINNALKN